MILGPIIGLVATATCLPVLIRLARRFGVEDEPDGELKPHAAPTPVLGGIGIAVGTLLGAAFSVPYAEMILGPLAVVFALCVVGLADDLRGLPPGLRFGLQIVGAVVLVFLGHGVGLGSEGIALVGSGVLTVLLFAAVVNTTNMLDGIDGLAGGCSVVSALGFAAAFHFAGDPGATAISLALAAAGLGFLLFNFPPARIFMGDNGSYFLGSVLALLLFRLARDVGVIGLVAGVLIVAVPLLDTVYAVARRLADHASPFAGDRRHAYDRMVQGGLSVRATDLALYGAAALFATIGILLVRG